VKDVYSYKGMVDAHLAQGKIKEALGAAKVGERQAKDARGRKGRRR